MKMRNVGGHLISHLTVVSERERERNRSETMFA